MKKFLQKSLSLLLSLSLLCPLAANARASEALGEDLTQRETLLNERTQLSTNVFWSTAYSDLRTENLITYTPNSQVTPIITYGSVLTDRSTVSATAKVLESRGMRVVAGINGDFYNTGTGLPIGLTVSNGRLISSDGGYYAIGFREDGSAILGKPRLKATMDLGYDVIDQYGTPTRVVRSLDGINKSRVSEGGIFLYTHDFNAKHTTGTTEPGIDVVCSISSGDLAIGEELALQVDAVLENAVATPIQEDQIVLSVNLKSNSYFVDAIRKLSPGSRLTLQVTAADPAWNDVEFALGALYSLVENGTVVSGLKNDVNPRTAVGQRPDGTLLFYTIDGRRSGHSIGASMAQVANRLIELGCTSALCLDGGGSTTLSVTQPDSLKAATVNRPSGVERAVTNHIFLVADNSPSGQLSHFYVQPEHMQVLAGSSVRINASAVDTNFIPMDRSFELTVDSGKLENNVLTTPRSGGTITVMASGAGSHGSATVQAISNPDEVAIRHNDKIVTELTVVPGSVTNLTVSAAYQHLPLYADPASVDWNLTGDIGTLDAQGHFTATKPGSGKITVTAGGRSAVVNVTVSRMPLKTVEDFEADFHFSHGYGTDLTLTTTATGDPVRFGRNAMKMSYQLSAQNGYTAEWNLQDPLHVSGPYTALNFWIYGDNSGNTLELLSMDEQGQTKAALTVPLDFTGWRQLTIPNWSENRALQGFRITASQDLLPAEEEPVFDENGFEISWPAPKTALTGTLYLDQFVAAFAGTTDTTVPSVNIHSVTPSSQDAPQTLTLSGAVKDDIDGVLPRDNIHVTLDGTVLPFNYNEKAGAFTASLTNDGLAHRLTVTAMDGSGNLGRASQDIPAAAGSPSQFTDTESYWGKTYVNYMYTSGITTGYPDGTFRPNNNISRAQFTVMLYRYLHLDESRYSRVVLPFADLAEIPAYALPAIRALYTEGIVNGSTGADGQLYFNPGSSLTRAQAATMIGRTQARGYALAALTFTDAASIPAYAADFIRTMTAQGVISGYADGSFKPHNPITRGQMAKILYNLM